MITNKKIQRRLRKFYRTYYRWLNNGAVVGKPYYRDEGLCSSLHRYLYKHHSNYINIVADYEKALHYSFDARGLDKSFPFDEGESFTSERQNHTTHLNAKRIQWVKDHYEPTWLDRLLGRG